MRELGADQVIPETRVLTVGLFVQVISGEDLRPVHGASQPGHRGEDEVSVLPVRLPGHQRCQVSPTHTHTHRAVDVAP